MANRWNLPVLGYGIGLRTVRFADLLDRRPAVDAPIAGPASRDEALAGADLVALGVSRATIRNWLAERVLEPTDRRGVYARTNETTRRIKAYLGRRRRSS